MVKKNDKDNNISSNSLVFGRWSMVADKNTLGRSLFLVKPWSSERCAQKFLINFFEAVVERSKHYLCVKL